MAETYAQLQSEGVIQEVVAQKDRVAGRFGNRKTWCRHDLAERAVQTGYLESYRLVSPTASSFIHVTHYGLHKRFESEDAFRMGVPPSMSWVMQAFVSGHKLTLGIVHTLILSLKPEREVCSPRLSAITGKPGRRLLSFFRNPLIPFENYSSGSPCAWWEFWWELRRISVDGVAWRGRPSLQKSTRCNVVDAGGQESRELIIRRSRFKSWWAHHSAPSLPRGGSARTQRLLLLHRNVRRGRALRATAAGQPAPALFVLSP